MQREYADGKIRVMCADGLPLRVTQMMVGTEEKAKCHTFV